MMNTNKNKKYNKIQNTKQEDNITKTRNSNLQNNRNLAGINLLIAVFILLIIGATANAKEKVKLPIFNSLNAAELSITDKEEENTIDEWMINNTLFTPATINAVETDQEAILELGNWMLDASHFSYNFNFKVEKEEDLALSDWMTNENFFSSATTILSDKEEELVLENWISDFATSTIANAVEIEVDKEQAIEEWMLNENIFTCILHLERDSDTEESVEAWMFNENLFQVSYTGYLLMEQDESALAMEDWMVNIEIWNDK